MKEGRPTTNPGENSASAAPERGKPKFVSSESESRSPSTQREEPPKSKQRGAPASTNVFYNFLMGAGLTAQGKQNVEEEEEDEDEPFVFVNTPDRFGLYDSTDSEISELRYPIREPPVIKGGRPKRIIKEPTSPVGKAPKDGEGISVGSSLESKTSPISKAPKEGEGFSVGSSLESKTSPISKAPKEGEGFSVGSSFESKTSPISKAPKEGEGFSVGSSFESKPSPISKNFNVDEGSFDSDLRAHEKLDATSTVISIDERFLPSRIISVGERPHPSRERDISRIISIENRFGTSTVTAESPGEEISSSKEESAASEESGSKNTASSGSTATSEESSETDHNKKTQINYRVNVNGQRKSNRVNYYKNTDAIVQQALNPKSNKDIYYTPESSATKELAQLKKETERPKAEEIIKIKRADAVSQVPTIKEGRRREFEEEAPREEQIQEAIELEEKRSPSSRPVGRLNESARKRLSRLLESQMSDDRKRGSLDRQSARYSRDPPERDQNYDDSLMKKNHHQQQQQQPSELQYQGPKPWCSCKNADDCRRLNHQQQYSRKNCPEHRRRTTYDLVKSAENLRQQNQEQSKTPCACPTKSSKQGQQSQSSPEVSKNKQNMKSEDHADEYYSDYAGKNEGYGPNQMKPRKYPYEEPLQEYGNDYNNENHERNCACDHCNRRNRYRNCKCCNCTRNDDDHVSSYSDDSQCNLNLAYQKSDDYPELVDEIENSISRRNKERVKKTMRQFEMLSRQNKGLEKPIYDDDEEDDNVNRFPCNKRTCPVYSNRPRSREAQYYNNQKPRPPCCCDRRNYQTKSECLSERPAFSATPFPRPRGFVEKVARYMDPSMPEAAQKYPRYRPEYPNGRWQMDPRSGEWVKICDDGYDFENNYPPLPAPPPPIMYRECAPPYRDYESYHKNQGNPNFFNAPPGPYRAQVAFKRSNTPTKQCQCRNCMQPPNNPNNPNNNNNRY